LSACEEQVIVGATPVQQEVQSPRDPEWSVHFDLPAPAEGLGIAGPPDESFSVVIGYATVRDALERPNRDIVIARLDLEGEIVWSHTIDFSGLDDTGYDVAVNAQHEVLAVGSVTDAAGIERAWISKWSPSGEALAARVAGDGESVRAKAVATWETDAIVASFKNSFEMGRDVVVERVDGATLAAQWTTSYNGPLDGEDEPHQIAIWRSSPMWITGYQQTEIAGGSELSLLELKPDGTLTWQRSLKNAEDQILTGESNSIAVNDLDNVYYLCGALQDPAQPSSTAAVFKLGYRGDLLWQSAVFEASTPGTTANGCSLGSGNLSVVGTERQGDASQLWLATLSPTGETLSLRTPPGYASGRRVMARTSGAALVTGQDTASGLFVAKFIKSP
jgi:hypothetical protein